MRTVRWGRPIVGVLGGDRDRRGVGQHARSGLQSRTTLLRVVPDIDIGGGVGESPHEYRWARAAPSEGGDDVLGLAVTSRQLANGRQGASFVLLAHSSGRQSVCMRRESVCAVCANVAGVGGAGGFLELLVFDVVTVRRCAWVGASAHPGPCSCESR